MPSEDQPTQPHERKFGSQFYQKPDFFLNQEHTDWMSHPEKTITHATMMASLAHGVLTQTALAHETMPEEHARRGLPTPDELATSQGAEAIVQSTEAINLLANQHVEGANSPEEHVGRIDEVKTARDLGLQGAAQWWAGNIGGGGGGHAPRVDLAGDELETGWTEITPDPNINDPNAEFDPYLSYPDTDLAGVLEFAGKHGPSGASTDPNRYIASMLEPMSSMPFGPEDFEDN
jgi:hypothetical protein